MEGLPTNRCEALGEGAADFGGEGVVAFDAVLSEATVQHRTYDQWGMQQGDLKDWSALTKGEADSHATGTWHRGADPRWPRTSAECETGSTTTRRMQPVRMTREGTESNKIPV